MTELASETVCDRARPRARARAARAPQSRRAGNAPGRGARAAPEARLRLLPDAPGGGAPGDGDLRTRALPSLGRARPGAGGAATAPGRPAHLGAGLRGGGASGVRGGPSSRARARPRPSTLDVSLDDSAQQRPSHLGFARSLESSAGSPRGHRRNSEPQVRDSGLSPNSDP